MGSGWLRARAAAAVPARGRAWLRAQQRRYRLQRTRMGTVELGALRRLRPVSRVFALDRGQPIDRYYIERFLSAHSSDVRGRVLEVGDDNYTVAYGGGRVSQSDVLHLTPGNPRATIVGDLTRADPIPSETFDCILLTQTLQMIYEVREALGNLHRILAPGGVLLATAHGISRVARREGVDPWGEYWHFTSQSLRRLFAERFPADRVEIEVYGNVLAAIASLHGLAAEELTSEELDHRDPDYELLIGVRAQKPIP
jgi:SAM-dependent methyltransferase